MKKLLLLLFPFLLLTSCSDDSPVKSNESQSIVFITDYEESSEFWINLKGQLKTELSDAEIEYYKAEDFNIFDAANTLSIANESYPAETIFIGYVEPGENSSMLIFQAQGKYFVFPDNGLGTFIMNKYPGNKAYRIEAADITGNGENISKSRYFLNIIKSIKSDKEMSSFGPVEDNPEKLTITEPSLDDGVLSGQIMQIDNFGNCVTNIKPELVNEALNKDDFAVIMINGIEFKCKFGDDYSSVLTGSNVCLINSSGYLQFSVNKGNMSLRNSIQAGHSFTMKKALPVIGILKYNESPVVEDILNSVKSRFNELGLSEENTRFIEKNAAGNASALNGLIKELMSQDPDVVISVSTPASQAAVNELADSIPLIFTYVTDPQSAGLLNSARQAAGCSDATNFKDYLDFVDQLVDSLFKAGMIYSSNEANAIFAKESIDEFDTFYEFDVLFEGVTSDSEINGAFDKLNAENPEAFIVAADNMLSDNIEILAGLCSDHKIPLIGDSYEHSEKGALASISVNYEALGQKTADMVMATILGNQPDNRKVEYFKTELKAFNLKTAEKIGFNISEELKQEAAYIFE
ncbi:MAG: SAM-dependent chlorinase/fluorinase [Candidatus Kapaibacterium sp.]